MLGCYLLNAGTVFTALALTLFSVGKQFFFLKGSVVFYSVASHGSEETN